MKTIRSVTIACIVLLSVSCDKDVDYFTLQEGDYFLFGRYYGMCAGEECVEVYQLTETDLYKDTNDSYMLTDFKFKKLSHAKFLQAKDLPGYLPDELLLTDEAFLGCPDCVDQGGIFIQLSQNGVVKTWRIDQRKDDIPEYLHDFVDKVNEKIELLRD